VPAGSPQQVQAGAQTTARDPAAAEQHFKQGVAAAERGDWDAACASFQESHALDPAPGTLFRLADCEEHRGKLATAWTLFQDSAQRIGAADKRYPAVKARADALEARVPWLTVRLEPNTPREAVVKRDGVVLGLQSVGVALPVDPGEHEILVDAPGRAPRRYPFRMTEGEKSSMAVGVGPSTRRPTVVATPAVDTGAQTRRTVGFVVGGLGVAGLVAGGALTLALVGAHDTVEEHCTPDRRCDPEGLDAAERGPGLSTAATIATLAGAAALVAGATLVLTSGGSSRTTVGARAGVGGGSLIFARSLP